MAPACGGRTGSGELIDDDVTSSGGSGVGTGGSISDTGGTVNTGGSIASTGGADATLDNACTFPPRVGRVEELSGCPCTGYLEYQGFCVPGASMMCWMGEWESVQDGPCMLHFASDCEALIATLEECLQDYYTCFQLEYGKFCAHDPL